MTITAALSDILNGKQQSFRLESQTAANPAFSGVPNDWLSPTDWCLGSHGACTQGLSPRFLF